MKPTTKAKVVAAAKFFEHVAIFLGAVAAIVAVVQYLSEREDRDRELLAAERSARISSISAALACDELRERLIDTAISLDEEGNEGLDLSRFYGDLRPLELSASCMILMAEAAEFADGDHYEYLLQHYREIMPQILEISRGFDGADTPTSDGD